MEPHPKMKNSTVPELRAQSPQERQHYLLGMVKTIERKYPEMDPGAKASFSFFLTEITPIVRPSGGEKATREHLIAWSQNHEYADQMSLAVDNAGNLLITIEATNGYEDIPGSILQSHMDMNCNPTAEQRPDISPATNPVIPVFKDNETKIGTEGTTLGADDGLGIATAITLAEELFTNSVPHGKVALLFTTDEEVGLTGAQGFSFPKELLQGYKYYFNLDNEETHEAIVGAAGGIRLDIRLPITRESETGGRKYLTLGLGGLTGGHSGAEIHLGHLNAIKVMQRMLTDTVSSLSDVRLVTFDAGTADSSIPQRAKAIIAIQPDKEELLKDALEKARQKIMDKDVQTKHDLEKSPVVKEKEKLKNKLQPETPHIEVSETSGEALEVLPMTAESTHQVFSFIESIPSGPLEIDEQYNIVKTSTNMGVLQTLHDEGNDYIQISSLTRSSSEQSMEEVNRKILEAVTQIGATSIPTDKRFSPWEPDFSDPLLQVAQETHIQATGKALEVNVIHAGLESHTIYLKMRAILGDDMPEDFHIISLGPTLDGPHSENENFPIEEAAEFFPAMRLLFNTVLDNELAQRRSIRRDA